MTLNRRTFDSIVVESVGRASGVSVYSRIESDSLKVMMLDPDLGSPIPPGEDAIGRVHFEVSSDAMDGFHPLNLVEANMTDNQRPPEMITPARVHGGVVLSGNELSLSRTTGYPGETVVIEISSKNVEPVAGFQADLVWVNPALSFVRVESTGRADALNAHGASKGGDGARVVLMDLSGGSLILPGEGSVMRVWVLIAASADPAEIPIRLESTTLVGPNGKSLPVISRSGTVAIEFYLNIPTELPLPALIPRVVIDEILADPPDGDLGDVNRDGTRNGREDEFVEIANLGSETVAIGGWSLSDDDVSETRRFRFPSTAELKAGERAVLFGGGEPEGIPGKVFSDDGSIGNGLANSGDVLLLIDPTAGDTIARVEYTAKTNLNTSLALDEMGIFVPHNAFPGKGEFSPGIERPTAVGLQIEGVGSLVIGESIAATALAQYTDGDEVDVTHEVLWEADSSLLQVDEGGELLGISPGMADLSAAWHTFSAQRRIRIHHPPARQPLILGEPPGHARVGVLYTYLPKILHLHGGRAWVATNAEGVQVNPVTGGITWRPEKSGTFSFILFAPNPQGREGRQAFTVLVTNRPAIVISEILADPPPGPAGDANGDGERDGTADEFVEILNQDEHPVPIGGWQLSDDDVSEARRFTFPEGTLLEPGERSVLFGGGSHEKIPGLVFADDGSIGNGLTNSGDILLLFDPVFSDTVAFASYTVDGDLNQSLVPRGRRWIPHAEHPGQAPFSPGRPRDWIRPGILSEREKLPVDDRSPRIRPKGVIISEIYADPALGPDGDANGDGVRHPFEDEFVELWNSDTEPADLSHWRLGDDDVSVDCQFKFPEGTVLRPGEYVALFGGGDPLAVPGKVFADDGRIGDGLSNGGDRVLLISEAGGDTLDQVRYDKGRRGVSWVSAQGGILHLHDHLPGRGRLSPGRARTQLTHLDVMPDTLVLEIGATGQLMAFGTFTDDLKQELTERVDWSVTDSLIAGVDQVGRVTGLRSGSTTVEATVGGLLAYTVSLEIVTDEPFVERKDSLKSETAGTVDLEEDSHSPEDGQPPPTPGTGGRDEGRANGQDISEPPEPVQNLPPIISSWPETTAVVGLQYLYRVSVSDSEEDSVHLSAPVIPDWLTLAADQLAGTPAQKDAGHADVELEASDEWARSEQRFRIRVLGKQQILQGSPKDSAYVGLTWRWPFVPPTGVEVQADGGPVVEQSGPGAGLETEQGGRRGENGHRCLSAQTVFKI